MKLIFGSNVKKKKKKKKSLSKLNKSFLFLFWNFEFPASEFWFKSCRREFTPLSPSQFFCFITKLKVKSVVRPSPVIAHNHNQFEMMRFRSTWPLCFLLKVSGGNSLLLTAKFDVKGDLAVLLLASSPCAYLYYYFSNYFFSEFVCFLLL